MELLEQERPWVDRKAVGSYFRDLLLDSSWIVRRVETIHILELERIERRVSVDVDYLHLARTASKYGLDVVNSAYTPLVVLDKGLLLDIDVHHSETKSTPIVTSQFDSSTAQAAILACLEDSGIPFESIPDVVKTQIYEIALDEARITFDQLIALLANANESVDPEPRVPEGQLTPEAAWQLTVASPDAVRLLKLFVVGFMVIVKVPVADGVTTMKYRLVERLDYGFGAKLALWNRLGFRSMRARIRTPALGVANSEHLRVVAPPGATISDALLVEVDGDGAEVAKDENGDKTVVSPPTFQFRTVPARATIHTRQLPQEGGERWLWIDFRPRLSNFYIPSLIAATVSLGFLIAATIFQFWDGRFSSEGAHNQAGAGLNAEAAVAVLAIAPSILAVYAASSGEHDLVSKLLLWPRLIVILSAIGNLFAAGAVAADITPDSLAWVFLGSSFVSLIATLVVAVGIGLIWKERKRLSARPTRKVKLRKKPGGIWLPEGSREIWHIPRTLT